VLFFKQTANYYIWSNIEKLYGFFDAKFFPLKPKILYETLPCINVWI